MEIGRDAHGIKSLSRHTLEQLVVLSSEAFVLLDAKGPGLPVVFASPAYEGLVGCSSEDLVGHAWALIESDSGGDAEVARLKAAVTRSEACRASVSLCTKDGQSTPVVVAIEPLHNARGDLKYLLCTHRVGAAAAEAPSDAGAGQSWGGGTVSFWSREAPKSRAKPAVLDRLDPATGLLRFGHFQEALERDLTPAEGDRCPVTLLVFSIVEFDVYRQTFGSKAADSCQRMIGAQIVRTLRRAGDLCARYDDSTLVAAVIGQGPEDVRHLAERIADNVRRLALHNPRGKSGRYITIRPAVVACGSDPGDAKPAAVVAQALESLRSDESFPAALP
jgi:diguanylate cyclase (GGDEF)-like protein/PAS domain S-box-containing protein